tara:strand:+ start:43 stop:273 length:231 start_codon:yes stop_codon:yes gene_type:complete
MGVEQIPIQIGKFMVKRAAKKAAKKGAKKLTKKERALKAAEAEVRYEQGLGLFEVPLAGLKKGGMVIKDKQYLKGK